MEYAMSPAQMEPAQSQVRVQYAGFWMRFFAMVIDGFIVSITGWIIIFLTGIGNLRTLSTLSHNGHTMSDPAAQEALKSILSGTMISILCLVVLNVFYFALMESSSKQATLGKMALGLKVTDLNGNRLSFGKALLRTLGKIVSGLILYIGYIMAAFTEKKQALHDLMAGTLVLSKSNVVSPEIAQQAYAQPAQS